MRISSYVTALFGLLVICEGHAADSYIYEAGHETLQEWLLPDVAPDPVDNPATDAKVVLGKALFFDPRLSHDGNMSCATCHNPSLGWGDGLPTAIGFRSSELARATPTVINAGFNSIQMWDGREPTLESQAMGPMESSHEMNMETPKLLSFLRGNVGYQTLFDEAFPGEEISTTTLSKAIAAYERTIVSNDSPFDRWVRGDEGALTESEVNGFKLFTGKANCAVCHSAPNFTDNGFHNLGLASFGDELPDLGRYLIKPLGLMKGAFKTPTVREVARTAPYFHDGSAATLEEVVEHYAQGGVNKSNLSPNMKPLTLSATEKQELVLFMRALSSPFETVTVPELPQ